MNLYFDSTATTKVCNKAVEAMKNTLDVIYGNPSSKHFEGLKAEELIMEARKFMAKEIGCTKDELYFTSGGTESNNLGVQGVAKAYQRDGLKLLTTPIEHPSVGTCLSQLEEEGYEVVRLSVDEKGFINIEELKSLIDEETTLVSIMYVNNEIGTMQDIYEIGKVIKEVNPKTLFHVDHVQGFMKFDINVKKAKIDLLSASSHKIYGPKGSGFLYVRNGVKLKPLQYGGSQQKGIRPGTENVPGIVGFYEAAKDLKSKYEEDYQKVLKLKNYFVKNIRERLPLWLVNSPESNGDYEGEKASPYILSIRSNSLKGEVILHALEDYKICVSTGSACSSKKLNVSHVLKSLGLTDEENDRAIRISFSAHQTREDVDELLEALVEIDTMFGRFIKK